MGLVVLRSERSGGCDLEIARDFAMARAVRRALDVRPLTPLGLLLLSLSAVGSAGCHSGVISLHGSGDAGALGDGSVEAGPSAQRFFETSVEGMLAMRCGGCHGAARSAPDFLRPDPDVRTTLLAYPALIDLTSPRTSRLLTKGEHSGPSLTTSEADLVRTWIELEAAEGTMVTPMDRELATTPVEVREGFNQLPLDVIGLPATSLHFVATRVGDGMFLDSVQLSTGPMGARLEHPVFVTWIDAVPHPDPVDRFSGMTLEVEPNTSASFDTGTVVITEMPAGALLSVHFTTASPITMAVTPGTDAGMPMPPSDGCTQLEAFRASAVPPLRTYCTRCHGGGNASATGSMDMTDVTSSDDATALDGCNQVLGRISAAAPSSSGLFTQPDPEGGSTHAFHFGTSRELDTFRTSLLAWFEMEAP